MIFDSLKNIYLYRSKNNQLLNLALQMASELDSENLALGQHYLHPKICVIKKEFDINFPQIQHWGEWHDHTIDIHLFNNQSNELVYFKTVFNHQKATILSENPQKDVIYFQTSAYDNVVVLSQNMFVLFWPKELHYCCLQNSLPNQKYHKILFKVLL